jgi:hypothetical protein
MITNKTCVSCGRNVSIELTQKEFEALQQPNRGKIQDILPNHTPEEREMFVSGICIDCWNKMFGEDQR